MSGSHGTWLRQNPVNPPDPDLDSGSPIRWVRSPLSEELFVSLSASPRPVLRCSQSLRRVGGRSCTRFWRCVI